MVPQGQRSRKLDIAKLQYPKVNKEFVAELRSRFSKPDAKKEEHTINSERDATKTTYYETAQRVLGFKPKGGKEWIPANTWRKQQKAKLLNIKSQRLLEKAKTSYKIKDREVKRRARRESCSLWKPGQHLYIRA